jgi:16S rRNA (adenine1518-N6/adenine1519-N6)-dimethyltransferase
MSLDQIEQLLQTYHISPNKVLGQNFLVDPFLYPRLASYADLHKSDLVLDVGAGFGFLTLYLAEKCKAVVAVEKDLQVAAVLRERVKQASNIEVIEGDVLKVPLPEFNKVIAAPPYYLSSHLVTWLLSKPIECAILVVQKEFAQRLIASVGSEEYGWLTVVTYQQMEVSLLDGVPKEMFIPAPEVDSIILSLKMRTVKPFEINDEKLFVQMVKWLFTERNKKLAKAVSPFLKTYFKLTKQEADKLARTLPFHDMRPRELSPEDFGALANALPH